MMNFSIPGLYRPRNFFEAFENEENDLEDDFNLPCVSDDSGSSTNDDNEANLKRYVDLDLDWPLVTPQNEIGRPETLPEFTLRNRNREKISLNAQ